MEWKFFGCFLGLTLCIELLLCIPILKLIKKVRKKNYDKIQTKVIAKKISEKYVGHSNADTFNESSYLAVYEWIYNEQKRKLYVSDRGTSFRNHITMYHGGTFPETMEITIDKKTGEYKKSKAETIVSKLIGFTMLVSFGLAYYLSILITGINPIAK